MGGRYANGAVSWSLQAGGANGTAGPGEEWARNLLDEAHQQGGLIQKSGFATYDDADIAAQNHWEPIAIAAQDEAQWFVVQLAPDDFAFTYPSSGLRSTGNPKTVDMNGQLMFLHGHGMLRDIRGSGHTHPFSDTEFSGHDGMFLESLARVFDKQKIPSRALMLSLSNRQGEYRTVRARDLEQYKSSTGNYLQSFPGKLRSGVTINTIYEGNQP